MKKMNCGKTDTLFAVTQSTFRQTLQDAIHVACEILLWLARDFWHCIDFCRVVHVFLRVWTRSYLLQDKYLWNNEICSNAHSSRLVFWFLIFWLKCGSNNLLIHHFCLFPIFLDQKIIFVIFCLVSKFASLLNLKFQISDKFYILYCYTLKKTYCQF